MKKHLFFAIPWWSCLCLLVMLSCGGGEKANTDGENSAAFDSVKAPVYSGNTAVGVTHEVKDYAEWLKVYNNVSDPASRISIYASPDDPNLITVFALTKTHEDARNAFSSPEFKTVLATSGVTSEPVFNYYDIKFQAPGKTDKKYRLGVSHPVKDYAQWKRVFDEDEKIRTDAGLELRAISTSADDPSMVHIMFATNDVDRAKDLIHSNDLKKRMAEGGVLAEPTLTVFKTPEN
ncbi:MAG TPA: hypothetical protein VG737_09410 [Cyclobacteriaceae bacterium]|nr:hypothetical protein [Cyclobacteriaceae bacterium]